METLIEQFRERAKGEKFPGGGIRFLSLPPLSLSPLSLSSSVPLSHSQLSLQHDFFLAADDHLLRVKKAFDEELQKLSMLKPGAAEANVTRNYLDWGWRVATIDESVPKRGHAVCNTISPSR
jgi:hypothetical protein